MQKKNERRTYLIEKSFQIRFIMKFSLLVVGGSLLIGLILYLLSMHSTTITFENTEVVVKTTADFLFPLLVQTILVVTIVVGIATVLLSLFSSHKIAGPLHRLKKTMEAIDAGDLVSGYKIRKDDAIHKFALSVDATIDKLRDYHSDLLRSWQVLEAKWQELKDKEKVEHKKEIEQLNELIEQISKKLHFFKLKK